MSLRLTKLLVFLGCVAAAGGAALLISELPWPGWGKFLLEIVVLTVVLTLYDVYRSRHEHHAQASDPGSSAV